MSARAGVSESIFYEHFSTFDACYRAAYEHGVDRLSHAVARAAELYGKSSSGAEPPATAVDVSRGNTPMDGSRGEVSARARDIARAAQLPVRATRRTTLVLRAIARTPYSNNREVAQAAGIADEGQASKLLARLERRGVIENVGVGAARGEPNAWVLTRSGDRTLELLGESRAEPASGRTGSRQAGSRQAASRQARGAA